MYNYIVKHMENNDIIFKQQFGFRQKHSTQHAVTGRTQYVALDEHNLIFYY